MRLPLLNAVLFVAWLGIVVPTNACTTQYGAESLPAGRASLHRFTRAARCSTAFRNQSPEKDRQFAFRNLKAVAQGEFTVWSIVYDVANRKVFYRTQNNANVRWFSLDDFDFSPSSPPVYLDINAGGKGNVAVNFKELTSVKHGKLLFGFFSRKDVKEQLGDLTPLAVVLAMVLDTYQPNPDEE